MCDILWSDPAQVKGWQQNSERGVGFLFGNDVLANFLKLNELDLICRSHQVQLDFNMRSLRKDINFLEKDNQ